MNSLTAHPDSGGESYVQHLRLVFGFGTKMAGGGLATLAHLVRPRCFVTSTSRIADAETMQPLDNSV
jgi:hypothetical protein